MQYIGFPSKNARRTFPLVSITLCRVSNGIHATCGVAMQPNRRQKKAEEQRKHSLKKRLDKLEDRHASEDIVYFDQLGVDCIFVDEVHSYKRNFFVTKMTRVKGLDNGASQKAFSLTLKLNQIREKTDGRNTYTATGTPVTNQLSELFNMVRYVSPESLSAFHVDTFDRFASTFTQSETAMELNAAGRLKMVSRFCNSRTSWNSPRCSGAVRT